MATVILQARLGSTRLPGKALKIIAGKPMLWYTIETLKHSSVVDRIVVAIPEGGNDDPLVELAQACGVDYFRGSELNVLSRFYEVSRVFPDRYYFRATGDNPILDYDNPARSLEYLCNHNLDYCAEHGMPLGSLVEAFTGDTLTRTFGEGTTAEDIEHVTWYMKKSGRFKTAFPAAPLECQMPDLRLTVDYEEDFKRVSFFIERLYRGGIPKFKEIIALAKESMALK